MAGNISNQNVLRNDKINGNREVLLYFSTNPDYSKDILAACPLVHPYMLAFKAMAKSGVAVVHIQHFHNFRTDDVNHNKCTITNTCIQHIYGINAYLFQINSPEIRTIFTKLRKDSNFTRDSRYIGAIGGKG